MPAWPAYKRATEANLDVPSLDSGNRSSRHGVTGNCHLQRLGEVLHDEHGKFPKGCEGERKYSAGEPMRKLQCPRPKQVTEGTAVGV